MAGRDVMVLMWRRNAFVEEVLKESLKEKNELNFKEFSLYVAERFKCSLRLAKETIEMYKFKLDYDNEFSKPKDLNT